ncbi:MAG: hypothetical protein PHX08_02455 [Lachnospiraceae bacterium]|nr:hypothetical protein [Lachnospiraceae bacterium]
MSKQDTKIEIMELLEENNFYSKMAMQKAGHVGLLVMAVYIIMKENAKGKEDKLSKIILTLTMILLLLDDVENIVHIGKKLAEN